MIMKRIIRLSVLVFVVLLAFSRSGTGSPAVQAQGSTIRIALNNVPVTLDPTDPSFLQSEQYLADQVYESLFRY